MAYKEITKYHSKMNEVPFGNLNGVEMDLFFSLCTKVKEHGLEKITLTFDQLRKLSNYTATSNNELIKSLRKTNKKIMNLQFTVQNEAANRIVDFVLFTTFDFDLIAKTLTVSVNEDFAFLLNDPEFFTQFELQEFVGLKSGYSKTLFRLLKQFRTKGLYVVKIDDFREKLEIPKSYKMSHIDQKILKPCIEELEHYFPNLRVEKRKQGRGNRVVGLKFTFDREIIENKKNVKPVNPIPKIKNKTKELPLDFINNPDNTETPLSPEEKEYFDGRISKLKTSGLYK